MSVRKVDTVIEEVPREARNRLTKERKPKVNTRDVRDPEIVQNPSTRGNGPVLVRDTDVAVIPEAYLEIGMMEELKGDRHHAIDRERIVPVPYPALEADLNTIRVAISHQNGRILEVALVL